MLGADDVVDVTLCACVTVVLQLAVRGAPAYGSVHVMHFRVYGQRRHAQVARIGTVRDAESERHRDAHVDVELVGLGVEHIGRLTTMLGRRWGVHSDVELVLTRPRLQSRDGVVDGGLDEPVSGRLDGRGDRARRDGHRRRMRQHVLEQRETPGCYGDAKFAGNSRSG